VVRGEAAAPFGRAKWRYDEPDGVAVAPGGRMPAMGTSTTKRRIRSDLDAAQQAFHGVLDALSDAEWRRQSRNVGWTNGEVMVHTFLAFKLLLALVPIVRFWGRLPARYSQRFAQALNCVTGPFNAINALGTRAGARIYTRKRLGCAFDNVRRALIRRLERMPDGAWQRGMHYPTRWDPLFTDYMTVEQTFAMPIAHLRFHLGQVLHQGERTSMSNGSVSLPEIGTRPAPARDGENHRRDSAAAPPGPAATITCNQ
jgi:hypothetical protein